MVVRMWSGWLLPTPLRNTSSGERIMGKGNNSQKNDKKNKKPKQDKTKPAPKK
jgi:hypothetical protein